MNERLIVPIVEGHGEVSALPTLLYRLAGAAGYRGLLRVNPPIRVKATAFLQPDHSDFRKHMALARAKAHPHGLVLLLFDCEDACPAMVGPELLARARTECPGAAIVVVRAYREFETWFLAAADSLRELGYLRHDATPPADPETIRDAKGWLDHNLKGGYDPVTHQQDLARDFDLAAARRVASFDRFYRRVAGYFVSGRP